MNCNGFNLGQGRLHCKRKSMQLNCRMIVGKAIQDGHDNYKSVTTSGSE